jgi:hypothetical protein
MAQVEPNGRTDIWIPRTTEYDLLLTLLDEEGSNAAVVSGAPGAGKSTLLRSIAKDARARGWMVLGPLPFTPATNTDGILTNLAHLVGADIQTPLATGTVRPDLLIGKDPSEPLSTISSHTQLLMELARQPLLLLIDGFETSSDVASWLTWSFSAELAKFGGRVARIVADRPDQIADLLAAANVAIHLEPLSEGVLSSYFAELGATLSPPTEQREVDVLTVEALEDPRLIDPLIRTLEFSRGLVGDGET